MTICTSGECCDNDLSRSHTRSDLDRETQNHAMHVMTKRVRGIEIMSPYLFTFEPHAMRQLGGFCHRRNRVRGVVESVDEVEDVCDQDNREDVVDRRVSHS